MATQDLREAATIRSRARAAARALKDLLKDKALPSELRKQVENLSASMDKTWSDLAADAKLDPEHTAKEAALQEAANMGEWFEAMLHLRFTEMADYAFSEGRLTREERIAVSHAIGQGLDAFHLTLMEGAVQLYARNPWAQPEAADTTPVMAAEGDHDETIGGEYVALVEKSVRTDGTIPVKIITPGWGSSGYYSAEMLERDAPKFKAGTKMYWDHPTASEERERPERSLRDLAAETVSDARWEPQGEAGPGLYAQAKVFSPYKSAVDELGPHIGVSIRALGKTQVGTAEGKVGKLISEISRVGSVDFVTEPGAGGQVLQIFESARTNNFVGNSVAAGRGDADVNHENSPKEEEMPEDVKALSEANAALRSELDQQKAAMARLNELHQMREASDFVSGELAKTQLPTVTRNRLAKILTEKAPFGEDGRLDVVKFAAQIAESVRDEQAYLAEAMGAGRISGFGSSQPSEPKPEQIESDLAEAFRRMGLDENVAKQAAKGR